MPEQEFELYLSALAKRLRLSPKQKTEIAAELRDQLESRFQSLLDAGLSREDAIRKALEDCGDGTVLARELAGVQRIVRRRRLVRIGLVGAGIAALLLLGVRLQLAYMEHADRQLALGAIRQDYIPQESSRDDGPSMMTVRGMGGLGSGPVVMVQNGGSGGIRLEGGLEGAGPVQVPRPAVEPTPAETLQRTLEERLDQIWDKDVDLVDVPCGEAFISIVRDEGKLPLIVRRTLAELMTTAVSVTLKVPKGSASLRTLLELLLEQAGIEGARLVVQDGLLVLTDVDSAARVEVYPIGHLLISGPTTAGMGAGDMAGGLGGGGTGRRVGIRGS